MEREAEVGAVERALAAYYEQEADRRAERPVEPQRVAARSRFMTLLGADRTRMLEVGIGTGRDSGAFVAAGVDVICVDVEHHSDIDVLDPPRFFSRRSNRRWAEVLATLGSVEEFETWGHDEGGFWYQWAVVRTSPGGVGA